jgi:hypothetical protein
MYDRGELCRTKGEYKENRLYIGCKSANINGIEAINSVPTFFREVLLIDE